MAEALSSRLDGLHLLIVEDDYLVAIDLAQSLEDLGAEVAGMARSVEDALAVIEAQNPVIDVAVLDVNLGKDRVYPVADALLARKIPFVFATGYDPWVIPQTYSAIPRVEKPVSATSLATLLCQQIALP